jgi:putative ABC transport system permease protein
MLEWPPSRARLRKRCGIGDDCRCIGRLTVEEPHVLMAARYRRIIADVTGPASIPALLPPGISVADRTGNGREAHGVISAVNDANHSRTRCSTTGCCQHDAPTGQRTTHFTTRPFAAKRVQPRCALVDMDMIFARGDSMNQLRSAFRVSADTLRRSPLRTFLSTLGIVIGVASLVTILSLADGMERFIRSQLGASTDLQLIRISARTSQQIDETTIPRGDTVHLTPQIARSLAHTLGDSIVVGLSANGVAVSTVSAKQRVVRIIAISPELAGSFKLHASTGRLLSQSDEGQRRVLLSTKAARMLAGSRREPLGPGDSIALGGVNCEIIGLVDGEQWEKVVAAVVPIASASSLLVGGNRDFQPSILIRAPTIEAVSGMRSNAVRWLTSRYGSAWTERLELANSADLVSYAQRGLLLFKLFMSAVTGISLIVGGIGVMNVLLAAVAERTREIGVRRAVGAARAHILAQFLAEAVTISSLGSAAGIALGLSASYGITAVLRARTRASVYAGISVNTIVVAVVATVVVGLSFGLYPALRASRLSPIDALRQE